ncbi:ABC transporter ATP-binding protein [Novibacillus thermophilus]|uniref:ABC transporter ATP-binding protein n=2 Tax=Novibacillus thermophilus TaxID=1471761 RepID=A0A1U9KC88_9BACL|nr:ABC transporter ATP-binding protein [Novibacillus thermophilus]
MIDLSYRYPTSKEDVLRQVNINIEKGCVYALIGTNGSGKTTLCNVMRGFIPHFYNGDLRGKVLVEGKDIREWALGDLAQKIGFVFENPFTQISGVKDTVFEEVAFGLENLGVEVREIKQKVKHTLQLLGIEELQDHKPQELSGGQKQRVAIASILAMEPDILVIDEPTSQLDPLGTEAVFKIIELMKKRGMTIILVEHKMELIAEYADYVFLMQDGRIVMQGDAATVFSDKRVLQFGVTLPQYALLGIEMNEKGMLLPRIPITEREAVTTIRNWLEGEGP